MRYNYKSIGNKPYLDPWKSNKFFTFAVSCANPVKWPQVLPIVAFGSNVLNCPLNGMNMEESSWIGEDLGAIRPTVCCPNITFFDPLGEFGRKKKSSIQFYSGTLSSCFKRSNRTNNSESPNHIYIYKYYIYIESIHKSQWNFHKIKAQQPIPWCWDLRLAGTHRESTEATVLFRPGLLVFFWFSEIWKTGLVEKGCNHVICQYAYLDRSPALWIHWAWCCWAWRLIRFTSRLTTSSRIMRSSDDGLELCP